AGPPAHRRRHPALNWSRSKQREQCRQSPNSSSLSPLEPDQLELAPRSARRRLEKSTLINAASRLEPTCDRKPYAARMALTACSVNGPKGQLVHDARWLPPNSAICGGVAINAA